MVKRIVVGVDGSPGSARALQWAIGLAVADREDADLIVVVSHGHGSFEDRVLGGVSYKVSHRAHRPVVIVPPEAA